MGKLKALILAAGEGTRMKSTMTKMIHPILGKPMINYVVDAYKNAGCDDIIIIAGDNMEVLKAAVPGAQFAHQKERRGTGHAVMCAEEFIDDDDTVFTAYGDGPLIRPEVIKEIILEHAGTKAAATIVSCVFDNPTGYGRVIRKNGFFSRIVEQRDANEVEQLVKEINTGLACYEGKALKAALKEITCDNAQNEYYLPDVSLVLKRKNEVVNIYVGNDPLDFYGINDRAQLAAAAAIIKMRINTGLMLSGVSIWDPANTYIGPDVTIGQGTTILPGAIIEGSTKIGEDCEIGPHTTIKCSSIGNNCKIVNSVLDSAEVHNKVSIGPYAYLRPGAVLMDGAKIGDFVEVKNAVIGRNSKANHLAYIGDAQVGDNVNFGCGAITVNYNGKKKCQTIIKDNAFVGSNCNLIAPVTVEKGGYVAAGSTVTKTVPEDCLTIARARQENKEGRAAGFLADKKS